MLPPPRASGDTRMPAVLDRIRSLPSSVGGSGGIGGPAKPAMIGDCSSPSGTLRMGGRGVELQLQYPCHAPPLSSGPSSYTNCRDHNSPPRFGRARAGNSICTVGRAELDWRPWLLRCSQRGRGCTKALLCRGANHIQFAIRRHLPPRHGIASYHGMFGFERSQTTSFSL